jgi:hypothetical protein
LSEEELEMAEGAVSASIQNDGNKVFSLIFTSLIKVNVPLLTADRYARFAQDAYNKIQSDPHLKNSLDQYKNYKSSKEIIEGAGKMNTASTLMKNAKDMNLPTTGFVKARAAGFATIFAASVDIFESIAKQNGIELNECALSICKVSLDIAAAGAGAVTIASGVGALLLLMSVYATGTDAYTVGVTCINPIL